MTVYHDINIYDYHTMYICLSTVFGENKRCSISPAPRQLLSHLTVLLLHPHVQRRQHQRQRPLSLISIPRRNINQNWQYGNNVTLNIEKTNAYLSSGIDTFCKNCGHKAAAKRGNTSNMFTYISEHHPSVKI